MKRRPPPNQQTREGSSPDSSFSSKPPTATVGGGAPAPSASSYFAKPTTSGSESAPAPSASPPRICRKARDCATAKDPAAPAAGSGDARTSPFVARAGAGALVANTSASVTNRCEARLGHHRHCTVRRETAREHGRHFPIHCKPSHGKTTTFPFRAKPLGAPALGAPGQMPAPAASRRCGASRGVVAPVSRKRGWAPGSVSGRFPTDNWASRRKSDRSTKGGSMRQIAALQIGIEGWGLLRERRWKFNDNLC
jgi:hypothetical protein